MCGIVHTALTVSSWLLQHGCSINGLHSRLLQHGCSINNTSFTAVATWLQHQWHSMHVCCQQVPGDASVLDMVFSDSSSPNSGFWDTNHGLGYHVPISGSSEPQPSLSIVHVSVEMAPIAKVSHLLTDSTKLTCQVTSRMQSSLRAVHLIGWEGTICWLAACALCWQSCSTQPQHCAMAYMRLPGQQHTMVCRQVCAHQPGKAEPFCVLTASLC